MGENPGRGRVLSTWKDISAYLQRSIRTCIRWEETQGLPVHRIGTGPKAAVFAYEHELDDWLRQWGRKGPAPDGRPPQARGAVRRLPLPVLAIAAGVILLAVSILLATRRPAQPADFRVDGSAVVILNERGRELWRHDTRLDDLYPDAYRDRFQTKSYLDSDGRVVLALPFLVIKDINGDGGNEVLFSIQTRSEIGEGELLCFDRVGRELWRYRAGREMVYGGKTYSDDYRIYGVDCADLNGDGSLETIVIAYHRPEWPCQLTLLDCKGRQLGEYWNGGQVLDYVFKDFNADGRLDIILCGVYNEGQKGFLAILDSADVRGGSPQERDDFISRDIGPGSEKYYIAIPRTDADMIRFPLDCVGEIQVLRNGRISAKTIFTALYYEFGANLDVLDIKDSHPFQQMHKELRLQGLVKSTLDRDYYEDLKKGVLYWSGKGWTSTPTMHNPWPGR